MKPHRGRQSGAALLALVFVVIAASAYLLVLKLNAATRPYLREQRSVAGLNEAKQALIAYALSFPDLSGTTDPTAGPGYLPCPDTDNDGSPNPPCGGPVALGRFPGEWLDVIDYEDHAGERFWYAISGNFRNNPKLQPLNSDTPGQLSVDGVTDVVAVIFAPGSPTEAQTGRPSSAIIDYLEGENADGDTEFSANAWGNDRLVYITRQELMQVIEKRVLGDVAKAFSAYQGSYGGYPWLSPFVDPSTSAFRGVPGTSQGHIPFHWTGSPAFTTDLSLYWNITNSTFTNPGASSYGDLIGFYYYDGNVVTPPQDCITSSSCTDGKYPGLSNATPFPVSNAACVWVNKEVFSCAATHVLQSVTNYAQQPIIGLSFALGDNQWILRIPELYWVRGRGLCVWFCTHTQYAYSETITRTYDINMTFTDNTSDGAAITGPDTSTVRRRHLTLEDNGSSLLSSGPNSVSITITDDRMIVATEPSYNTTYTTTATRTLNNDADTTGVIATTGIQFDIDLDGFAGRDANTDGDFDDSGDLQPTDPEIPEWFAKNDWQDFIYAAYPTAEALPGGGTLCTAGAGCLTVNGVAPSNNKRALLVAAGPDLSSNRPSANPTDYFEGQNASPGDEVFEKTTASATNNDQIRVIATTP